MMVSTLIIAKQTKSVVILGSEKFFILLLIWS